MSSGFPNKKMKGRIELPVNMVIIIIALMGIFMIIVLVYVNMGTSAKILKNNLNKLNAIDATHIVEDCLKNDNELILETFLNDNTKENGRSSTNICELCGICEILMEAKVHDLERNFEWHFDYSNWRIFWRGFKEFLTVWKNEPHTENSILVSIGTENGEVHIGKLYVWV